ncbi:putative phosphatidylinositol-3,4-bisphosphate 4-phosphatase [Trypoxylus dichotomus]
MDSPIYINILQSVMFPYAEENMPLRWALMQNNVPKHTSRLGKQWFISAEFPDLSPIENPWIDVKQVAFNAKSSNVQELRHTVESA